MHRFHIILSAGLTFLAIMACAKATENEKMHFKKFEHFTCSGKIGGLVSGIADRSVGGGDSMCYFISETTEGKKILRTCLMGQSCKVVGTVKNDQDAEDWSPIIVEIETVTRIRN